VSSSWAPRFPTWFKPEWGPQRFFYGGSCDNKPIAVVGSGWTNRYNGTRLTQNSSNATIFFTTAYEQSGWNLRVDDVGPGTARLTLESTDISTPHQPLPAAMHRWDQVRFGRFIRTANRTVLPPQFISSFTYHEMSATNSIEVTFQQPGIHYYGATPVWKGRAGGCTAGGEYAGAPSTHPVALIVAGQLLIF
jgi:hypothetical protein